MVCGTELSSQIHLTLSTNHSLILLIIQSLAQLCIPGFQFSIFNIRFSVPNPLQEKTNQTIQTSAAGRSWILTRSQISPFPNVNLLVFWLLVFWQLFYKTGSLCQPFTCTWLWVEQGSLAPFIFFIHQNGEMFVSISGISLHVICFMDPIRILSLSQRGKSPGRVGKSCHWQCIQNVYLLMEKSLKKGPPWWIGPIPICCKWLPPGNRSSFSMISTSNMATKPHFLHRKLSTRTKPEQCPCDVKPLQLTAASAIASNSGFLRMPKVPGVCALFARPCGANVAVRWTSEAQLDLQKNRSEIAI